MLVIGFGGSYNLVHEERASILRGTLHDASAVLLDNGRLVAAAEQERLDRIKHSNKFPADAIRACLHRYGAHPKDVDAYAYYSDESTLDAMLAQDYTASFFSDRRPVRAIGQPMPTARSEMRRLFKQGLDWDLGEDTAKLTFVRHHLAHAVSAFVHSGFDDALVLALDGIGDGDSGMVLAASERGYEVLTKYSEAQSLGFFYLNVIRSLGFRQFDEYKVMGLAPYGDPARFRALFESFYTLLPDGNYEFDRERGASLLQIVEPRPAPDAFSQQHKDLAAALQEALERIVLHIATHFQAALGSQNLAFAGGVAHNCTMNGKLARSGLFDRVFVHPAAHDAGAALGAALYCHSQRSKVTSALRSADKLDHLYWGSSIGENDEIEAALRRWSTFVSFERTDDIARRVAPLLAEGSVVGWAQGRAEFGPRALGNRSILADPRPPANKEVINAIVKKREAFRPFAPAVIDERAGEYFEIPASLSSLPFMIFVVKVRPEKAAVLGAVTHVDGTARVQTVSRASNPRYHDVISRFGEITGVPVLLNTSFNNNAEPIVDSNEDAIACFLTTRLHYLAIGDFLVSKRPISSDAYGGLVPKLPRHISLTRSLRPSESSHQDVDEFCSTADVSFRVPVSRTVATLLAHADGRVTLGELAGGTPVEAVVKEIVDLWSRRVIILSPV